MNKYDIIISPMLTEKSYDGIQAKRYTFKVDKRATKTQIKVAIEDIFGVKVEKVNTANYDGKEKLRTVIGDRAFVGCNTNFIAPVSAGAGSIIAAGTTVTDDVPEDALAVGRARQKNREGWAKVHGKYRR